MKRTFKVGGQELEVEILDGADGELIGIEDENGIAVFGFDVRPDGAIHLGHWVETDTDEGEWRILARLEPPPPPPPDQYVRVVLPKELQ